MRLFALAFAAALGVSAFAPLSASAETLEDAIAAAMASNPALEAAQARVDAADARLDQAQSAFWPQITARGQYASAETNFGAGRQDVEPRSGQISAEQLVFSGGRVWASVRQGRESLRGQKWQFAGARTALAADVADAYMSVLVAHRGVALRESNLRALSTLAEHAKLRFEVGEIPKSDLSQAQARRASAQASLARARADLSAARANYVRIVGIEPGALAPVSDMPKTPATLDEALSLALSANAQLVASRHDEKAAKANVWKAKSAHFPTVTVGVESSSVRDEFLLGYRADSTAFVARASVPIFTGGMISGQVREAKAQLREVEALGDAVRRETIAAVTRAFDDQRAAIETKTASVLQVEASRSALQSIRDEAHVGARPTIDVLDAERDDLEAQLALENAGALVVVAAYRLNALVGAAP